MKTRLECIHFTIRLLLDMFQFESPEPESMLPIQNDLMRSQDDREIANKYVAKSKIARKEDIDIFTSRNDIDIPKPFPFAYWKPTLLPDFPGRARLMPFPEEIPGGFKVRPPSVRKVEP